MAAPLLPTRYVNVAAAVTYSDLTDPLFRTYIRLVGLAWRDREHGQTQLPPLTLGELALVCHCRERGLRLHLQALERAGLIAVTGPASALHIRILNPDVQKFALPDAAVVLKEQEQQGAPAVQNFAPPPANLAALAACGVAVATPEAQAIAALAHVTPALIAAWHAELQTRPGIRNLPGLLLYTLRTHTTPPRAETRGGARAASAESPAPAPAAALPPALQDLLDELGFSGPRTALTAQYTADPQFVTAWIEHCYQYATRYKNPPGYLRTALRGTAYPPAPPPSSTPAPAPPPNPETAAVLAAVLRFYEDEIGPLSPAITTRLQELTTRYPDPAAWKRAFTVAVNANVRKLAYVLKCLENPLPPRSQGYGSAPTAPHPRRAPIVTLADMPPAVSEEPLPPPIPRKK